MSAPLDVYKEWLKIPDKERPLNYYQLLRVPKFEPDVAKIRDNYRKMNAHVRKFASGEFQQQSQDLLNELAKAMLCLTDAQRKTEYDASLGRQTTAEAPRTLEQILVSRGIVTPAQLDKARNYAKAVGLEVRDALVQQKLAPGDAVNQAYAESLGLPYLDLEDLTLDSGLLAQIPAVMARAHSCAPVMSDQDNLLLASPNLIPPDVEDDLRMRLGVRHVRTVICSPARINEVINKHYSKDSAIQQIHTARGGPALSGAQVAALPASQQYVAPGKPAPALTKDEREEAKKQQKMMTLLAFNFSMMVAMILLMGFVFKRPDFTSMAKGLLLALPIAGLVAWVVNMKYRP